MPFAGYKNFDHCVRMHSDKKDPRAYCATIMRATELLHEEPEVKTTATELIDANEAVFTADESTGQLRATVTIIKAGRSKNPRNYPEHVVKKAAESHIYDGLRMFVNHSEKPPLKRDFNEMVSAVESTSWDPDQKKIVGNVVFFDENFYQKAQRAKDFMGTSVSQYIQAERVRQPDGSVIEEVRDIPYAKSVDWVVYPAAGGEILAFESEEGDEEVDWDKITVDDIKTNAPDLWKGIVEAVKAEIKPPDGSQSTQEGLTEEKISQIVAKAIADHDAAKAQESQRTAEIKTKVQESLQKSGLPQRTRDRIAVQLLGMEQFDEKIVNEAVEAAKEELKAAGAGPRVTGMGTSQASEDGNFSTHPSGISVSESVAAEFGYKPAEKK